MTQTVTLALSGASGIPYGIRLLECLLRSDRKVYLVFSQAAQVVSAMETELNLPSKIESLQDYFQQRFHPKPEQLTICGIQQWSSPIASGSGAADAMVICPCSMGCLAAIANGMSDNLLERAADVMMKERKKLILVPRETPYSTIHLENMLKLSRAGVQILPANPGFYHHPKTVEDLVDFVVARILDNLDVPQELIQKWGANSEVRFT